MSPVTIALVGNPNCGKTTIFNRLSGSKQKIGNWPGVTIEKKTASMFHDAREFRLVDLPGIYSLSANSEDEEVARDYLMSGEADLLLNIVDASNLERNLLLTVQLAEMNIPMLVILNMEDLAQARGISIDTKDLARELSLPIVFLNATAEKAIEPLKELIFEQALKGPKKTPFDKVEYPGELAAAIERIRQKLKRSKKFAELNSYWLAIKLLEGDLDLEERLIAQGVLGENTISEQRELIEEKLDEDVDILIADARYQYISKILEDNIERKEVKTLSDKIDRIVLNRVLGIPIFLIAMYIIFWLTIGLGGVFIDFFDLASAAIFVDTPRYFLNLLNAPEWLTTIIASGVGGGLQTLASFLPIMFIMFFMLALLEDSGYMARAAFVVDRLMRFLGLPGKAFIPMLVGFGCTVPAIMATRTLENKRDKYLTIFMTPFMSCGARLPVYALFAAAFFPKNGQFVVFALYLIGILFAVLTGLLLKNTLFAGESVPMLMELPAYHLPKIRPLLEHSFRQLKSFFLNAGKTLIIIVIFLSFFNSFGLDGSFGNENTDKSVLAYAGKTITPVFSSFGIDNDNWPASVALLSGVFAKEVIVASLNSLYITAEAANAKAFNFLSSLRDAVATIPNNFRSSVSSLIPVSAANDGLEPALFSSIRAAFHNDPYAAFAYLLFILLYVPCVAVIATMRKEVGIGYTILQIGYSTFLAWFVASFFYQVFARANYAFALYSAIGLLLFVFTLKYVAKLGVLQEI